MKIFALLLIFLIPSVYAEPMDSTTPLDAFKQSLGNGPSDLNNPADSSVAAAYNSFALNHHMQVYRWQLLSSRIIFGISMLVVLCGLYLSYKQFQLTVQFPLTRRKIPGQTAVTPPTENTLELGKDGFKFTSAVIGLVILFTSIAFLFLYLYFVFPITTGKPPFIHE